MEIDTLPPTFTAGQARTAGVSTRALYRWRDTGEVVELSRGVFRHADAPPPTHPDLLAINLRAPNAVVCTLSAAAVHDLTDVAPFEVQIAVSSRTHPPRITQPPTTVLRFDPATHQLGVTEIEAAPGEFVPVYDPARTVVDLLRLRHRFGHDVAYSALNRYLARPDARRAEVYRYARALRIATTALTALDIAGAQ
ncbi:type IV toxin-antitoxin system AbiEi family antitoxin domain-containing protein [Kineococcus esterisolvens]|uniref:type IV toxin-antitoxin system AbiEi family antitoxin domain-containing protein n=1 Tax=unclassified Kineococcus TaxID=2621656 RepID=UPI003D7CFE4B